MSVFKRSALGLSLVACATLMLSAVAGSAHASGGAVIRNYQSGKCLDADANYLSQNGDRVQLWDCNGGDNQKWYLDPANPQDGTQFHLRNVADGKCLDADANGINNNGDKVQLWDCSGGTEQKWRVYHAFGSPYDFIFVNLANGKVLDADANGVNNNGGRVQVWDWWGGVNQIWQNQGTL
jgi:Ricin-type beta-trefoil lectin domain